MDTTTLIIIAVVIVLLVFAYWIVQRRTTDHLREGFGEEYDQAVASKGSLSKAERELAERQKRVSQYEITPLGPQQRAEFSARWQAVQGEFVDDPGTANTNAAALVRDAMQARGYPTENFESQAADLSVEHPKVVQHYRAAHAVALKHTDGEATTEELRRAMQDYRALFDVLVTDGAEDSHERTEVSRDLPPTSPNSP